MSDRIAVMSAGHIRQIAAPGEIYRRPADRFVASFVGDANVLQGRLVEKHGETATVMVGDVGIDVPAAPLSDLSVGDAVDVFVRPEHLLITTPTASGALTGVVTTQVFQGDHVDLYIDAPNIARDRILLRSPGIAALTSCPTGTSIGLTIGSDDIVAFPPEPTRVGDAAI